MAELIKKTELVEAMVLSHTAHANNTREASLLNRDVRIVMEQPTTTEAEIRAKAIDEFAEKCFRELLKRYYCLDALDITEIAEQLKEE